MLVKEISLKIKEKLRVKKDTMFNIIKICQQFNLNVFINVNKQWLDVSNIESLENLNGTIFQKNGMFHIQKNIEEHSISTIALMIDDVQYPLFNRSSLKFKYSFKEFIFNGKTIQEFIYSYITHLFKTIEKISINVYTEHALGLEDIDNKKQPFTTLSLYNTKNITIENNHFIIKNYKEVSKKENYSIIRPIIVVSFDNIINIRYLNLSDALIFENFLFSKKRNTITKMLYTHIKNTQGV